MHTGGGGLTVPGCLTFSGEKPDSAAVTDNVPVEPAPQPTSSRPTMLFYCFTYRVKNCLKYLSSTGQDNAIGRVCLSVCAYVYVDGFVDNTIFMGR